MSSSGGGWKRFQVGALLLGGCLLAGAGPWFAVDTYAFLSDSARAPGTVVALDARRVRGSTFYHPVVRFQPEGGATEVEFTERTGLWPSPHDVGDRVVVAYRSDEPAAARVVSFWMLWLMPLVLWLFGGACIFAGWHTHRSGT